MHMLLIPKPQYSWLKMAGCFNRRQIEWSDIKLKGQNITIIIVTITKIIIIDTLKYNFQNHFDCLRMRILVLIISNKVTF